MGVNTAINKVEYSSISSSGRLHHPQIVVLRGLVSVCTKQTLMDQGNPCPWDKSCGSRTGEPRSSLQWFSEQRFVCREHRHVKYVRLKFLEFIYRLVVWKCFKSSGCNLQGDSVQTGVTSFSLYGLTRALKVMVSLTVYEIRTKGRR